MTQRLKVLSLVHDLFYGGDETRLLNFSKFLDRDRFDHCVVSIHHADTNYSSRNGTMRDDFAAAGIEVIDLGKSHHTTNSLSLRPDNVVKSVTTLKRIVKQVREIVRERSVDVIDARLHAPMLIGAFVARRCGIPSVGTHYSFERADYTLARRLINQISFGMSHAVITDSEYWRRAIEKAIYWPGARIVNIPNGISSPEPSCEKQEVRRNFGIPDEANLRIVGQISRLVPYKGHAVLLDAAKQVLDAYPDAFFLVVGHASDQAYKDQLKQQAKRLGIANRVRITGYQGNIGDVWQIIDVHTHASHLDSLPNAIIEGMSLAKPAVVTDVGGIPDLVTNEETGLVVPTRDVNALADGILRLLRDPNEAKQFGDAANSRYQECYTPPIMARNIEDLFLNVCKQAR